jgi:hypothetical protein
MAALTLPSDARPANPSPAPKMSISVARALDTARLHLRTGNPGAYARALAGEHRAQNERQQRAIEAAIVADATSRLFTRHPGNGCLLAVES